MDHESQIASYSIEPYSIEAMPSALELAREVLGEAPATPKTEEFWQWKHHQNPFGKSAGIYAWDAERERASGLRILMRWALEADDQRIATVRAVDTATHPDHQRKGIFSDLTRRAVADLTEEGVSLIFNTPNRETSLAGYLKLGWRVVAEWPVYVRILRPGRLVAGLLRRRPGATAVPRFEDCFGPGILSWDEFAERYGKKLPELLAAYQRDRNQMGLRTPRDATYLAWRYGGHPHVRYGIYPFEEGERLSGLAIVRPNLRQGLQEAVLTELFLGTVERGMGKKLLAGLLAQLEADYVIAHFAQGTLEWDLLRRAGFFRVPGRGILFTAYPLGQLPLDALAARNWDLSLGDLEVF